MHHGSRPYPGPYRGGRGRRRPPETDVVWAPSAASATWDDVGPAPADNWAVTAPPPDKNWNLQQAYAADDESPDDSVIITDDELLKGRDGRWGHARYLWVTKGAVPYQEYRSRTQPVDVLSSLSEMVDILSRSWRHLKVAEQGDDNEAEEPEPPVPESVQRQRRRAYYQSRRRR